MKSKYIIIIILIVALGVGGWIFSLNKVEAPTAPPTGDSAYDPFQDPNVVARQLCFIWNTEAGDRAMLSMDLRGSAVIGELYWLPAEKDKKTGIFKGTVSAVDPYAMARTVNAIWDVTAEGVTQKEELIIKFGEGTANIGFGPMVNSDHGVYIYADPDHLSWEPNLSDTDCGDSAMD